MSNLKATFDPPAEIVLLVFHGQQVQVVHLFHGVEALHIQPVIFPQWGLFCY